MQTQAKPMTIGALARACGVGVETIRFYQRKGLMNVPDSTEGYRTYDNQHTERLRFIKRAQGVGFTLEETAELLSLNDTRDHAQARSLAREKIDQIEQRIEQLQTMAGALRHLVEECQHGVSGMPCPIIRLALTEGK
jgi:MerR family mercuric resistance operon transcriptional regulator